MQTGVKIPFSLDGEHPEPFDFLSVKPRPCGAYSTDEARRKSEIFVFLNVKVCKDFSTEHNPHTENFL